MIDTSSIKSDGKSPKENYIEFINSVKPVKNFESDIRPDTPNYSDELSWAALPGRDGFHNLSPDEAPSGQTKDYDVFYIHPTGYFQKHWNGPIDNESAAYERTNSHLAAQASAFSASCNVYAPYYRQATYYSFFDKESCGSKAQDLAYADLSNAFQTYLKHYNKGRPFFIAGHSQGALHGQRLVHEHISEMTAHENFIAAYLIGYILPLQYFDQLYPDLSISHSAVDQKVIISWCTGVEGFKRSRAQSMFWTPEEWKTEPMEQPLVCQNPLCWTEDANWIDDSANLAIRLKADNLSLSDYYETKNTHSRLSIDAIKNLSFEARYSDNYMIETRGSLIDKLKSFTVGGDLHNFDMSLFWGAIRNNVKLRANAFKK